MASSAVFAFLSAWTSLGVVAFQSQPNEAHAAAEEFSARHLGAIMETMTTESALRAMPPVPHELKALLVEMIGANASQVLRTHSSTATQPATGFLQASASRAGTAPTGVDGARAILNGMIKESGDKLDFEQVRCSSTKDKLTIIMEETRQDISEYNAQGADARAHILQAQTQIVSISETLPKLQELLAVHQSKCALDTSALESQLTVILKDISTLDKVVSMTTCAPPVAATVGALVQCKKKSRHHKNHAALSFITFSRKALRVKVAELKSKTAKAALQGALRHIYATARPLSRANLVLAQVGRTHHRRQHHRARRHAHEALVATTTATTTPVPGATTTNPRANAVNTSDAPSDGKQHRKCSIRNNPNCDKLKDKFLLMQTNIEDQAEGMKDELAATRKNCQDTQDNYDAQIAELERRLMDEQTSLAEGTKAVNEAGEQSRMKSIQLSEVDLEYKKTMSECHKNIEGVQTEICGIRQIRQELYKMSQLRPFIRDCEVDAWTPDECTASCGGGTQRLTRSIVVPPEMGADCPPLVMSRDCNERACPIDCHVSSWSGWSSCSAPCNGGVMQRARIVRTQAEHGGEPCGQTTQGQNCNIQSCDKDCELSAWTKWGSCSKACDGGFQQRLRHVATRAVGQGSCPSDRSRDRLEYKRCNDFECFASAASGILQCTAKLDVVILIDGSGSIGQDGWTKTKQAATTIINAFGTDVDQAQLAVLMFSGPTTWTNYKKCTGNGKGVNYAVDCNVAWVSRFSTDKATIVSNVGALAWPKASTLTSAALATAEAELANGRREAQAIVIVITDGRPMNPRKTYQAAKSLRRKARLMFVPVTRYAPIMDIRKWASTPVADNVLKVDDFSDLSGTKTINKIIADACPVVK